MFTRTPPVLLRLPASLSLALAAACSGGGDGAGSGSGSGGNVTLDTLPADQRAAFEAWKAQPIKDCLWAEAFAGLAKEALTDRGGPVPQPTPHVDVTALYADTHGSPLLQDAQGQIVLLGAPVDDPSSSRNQLDTTYMTDGHTTRSLSASAVRDHGECVVTLGGAEVFRTRMAASMQITAFTAAGSLDDGGPDLTAPVFDPTHAVGAITAAPLLANALHHLEPHANAQAVAGAIFHVDVPTSFQVFSLGAPQLPVTVRPALAGTPEFAPDAVIYGPSAAIAPLGGTTTIGLDLLFVPVVAEVATADPDQLLVVHAEIAVGPQGRLAHATELTVQPSIERSAAAAIACFANRTHLATAFVTAATPRLPGFDAVFSSCRDLAADGRAAVIADPASQQLIARATFTGPITATTAYLGWDTTFLAVVDHLVSAGTELAALDPDHANIALDAALARATAWRQAMPATAPAELRATVIPTALRWALDAVSILPDLDTLIPPTFTSAGAVYPASVRRMLDDVTAGAPAGLAAAGCGAVLSGDRAARVAATLAHAAALPEAQQFTDRLRDQMLQICPDDAALPRVDAAVDAASAFIADDRARGTTTLFASAARAVVDHAILEAWSTDTYAALGDLLALGVARHPVCAVYTSYAERLVCLDITLARFSAARSRLLDPALAARQTAFARDFLPIHQESLSGAAFADTRSAIDTAFFDRGLWTACTDQGFAAAQAALFDTVDQLIAASPADRPAIRAAIVAQLAATSCP